MGVRTVTTDDNIKKVIAELEKAERKGVRDSGVVVTQSLQANTPYSSNADKTHLKGDIKKSSVKLYEGKFTIDVGYSNRGWYYKFSDGGVNAHNVVRRKKVHNTHGGYKISKTKPYKLYQRKQDYVKRTTDETNDAVKSIISSEINKVTRKYNSRGVR